MTISVSMGGVSLLMEKPIKIIPSEARSLLGLDRGLYGFFASF